MDKNMKQLVAKSDQFKEQLKRFSSFLDIVTQSQHAELVVRTAKIEKVLDEFEATQLEIELLNADVDCSQERAHFEDLYFFLLGKANQLIQTFQSSAAQAANQSSNRVNDGNNSLLLGGTKLPSLGLPKFRGEFEKWIQFYESFQTLVDKNQCLDDIQKFYYLLDCLEGEARKVLECLEITRDNYTVALDLLEKRFQNKPVIIQTHIRTLVDATSVNKQNSSSLRNLSDTLERHIRALRTLGEPVDTWDRLLIFLMVRKLDNITRKEWEEKSVTDFTGEPTMAEFCAFLADKCRLLETLDSNNVNKLSPPNKLSNIHRGAYAAVSNENVRCEFCKGTHFVYRCESLLKLSTQERSTEVKKLKLCFNCLRSGHRVSECKSGGCRICQGRHNTLLHATKPIDNKRETTESNKNKQTQSTHACIEAKQELNNSNDFAEQSIAATSCRVSKTSNQVILSTAIVYIKGKDNNFVKCRALLDSGSQMNFMSQDLANRLKVPIKDVNIPISGVNELLTKIKQQTSATIKSVYNNYSATLSFLVLENITSNIPVKSFDTVSLNIPQHLKLADRSFNVSSTIDILIGASLFFNLLCVGQIRLGNNKPLLQKSVLGWIVSGSVGINETKDPSFSFHTVIKNDIQGQLERFWKIEELEDSRHYSKEEVECEQNFMNTFSRDKSGRFLVTLPVKPNVTDLGSSFETAKFRLLSLEKKFARNLNLKQKYSEFIEEYKSLGHMSKIDTDNIHNLETNVFYLPHHCVINENSVTTKLRVVFDGSAKTSSGISLNDVLRVGPKIQDDLFDILIRFRQKSVVLTADIVKMYRQVKVAEHQRDLQRILWRSDPDAEVEHYQLNTITYGTAPASFLATRCLQQIAHDIKGRLPEISNIILKNFYVDDLLLSVDSKEKAVEVGQSLIDVLNQYGFPLRKWSCNKTEVLDKLKLDNYDDSGYLITDGDVKKTLGLFWRAKEDCLEYIVAIKPYKQGIITKRFILSVTSQIFDPLGLVGPVTIKAKILLQKLWQLKLDWDEIIPLEFLSSWNEFYNQLKCLNVIRVPRQCSIDNAVSIEIHGFCDASETSYGCCLYLRSVSVNGLVQTRLLCAKSRVAPIKSVSLPRLELCGAVLLAKLVQKVTRAFDIMINDIFLWTDSTIVLSWLSAEPNQWKTFIANRVSEIQRLTQNYHWRHVISKDNPADIISRGSWPSELQSQELWWLGPSWLLESQENWPKQHTLDHSAPEKREVKLTFTCIDSHREVFCLYSSLLELLKTTVLCLRFCHNVRNPIELRRFGKISIEELDSALLRLIKVMQHEIFKSEINALQSSKCLPKQSSILSLNPFLDKDNLLRVGGRIRNSNESFDVKFPIILPQKHQLTRLIILNQHHKQLHAGPQAILAALRQRFWPINGRSAIRSVLSKCITCFRAKPISLTQKMGDLPRDRVTPQRPFLVSGVDFAGPFNLKDGKCRNRTIVKGYMCLFICFVTKAIHVELVGDLTTKSFLNCLKRFVSRRGLCARIYSDNATNFIGAKNEICKLSKFFGELQQDNSFRNFCLESRIDWQFIPPRSPHHGGLWESAIKSAKHLLVRTMGNSTLTFEDMLTLMTQVEAVLNSRPLTPLSSNPSDLLALTPSHFLIGESLMALPQRNVTETAENRLDKYHAIQRMYQLFWKRWSHEYLSSLQDRSKWRQQGQNVQPGTMVLLMEDNVPPLQWRLGRVKDIHPGSDGVTRVVTVLTNSGVFKRAVQKLCALPIDP